MPCPPTRARGQSRQRSQVRGPARTSPCTPSAVTAASAVARVPQLVDGPPEQREGGPPDVLGSDAKADVVPFRQLKESFGCDVVLHLRLLAVITDLRTDETWQLDAPHKLLVFHHLPPAEVSAVAGDVAPRAAVLARTLERNADVAVDALHKLVAQAVNRLRPQGPRVADLLQAQILPHVPLAELSKLTAPDSLGLVDLLPV
eukprot:CAMPEP_0171101880 /NCGR_PEP_ID=MMETSP0766_2-20121228/56180_1 /TAXON_ID=439317 /ORGANISM="Gambierdiscus australes, Strain CAWD 149" /LENGTH=201 /DNA_ID=CAMNT_0011562023 /DNA_START=87 /DNA_END=693 /DNA_ORIENTATION=-